MGSAARLDEAKQQFKALKEKAEHYVTADGKKIGGVPREKGDIFTFLNKLLKHELARAGTYPIRSDLAMNYKLKASARYIQTKNRHYLNMFQSPQTQKPNRC